MASLQARHSRRCALGRVWDKADEIREGCTCQGGSKSGLTYYVRHYNETGDRLLAINVGKVKKEAERALVRMQDAADSGTLQTPSALTFSEWADQWHASLKRPGANTLDSYRYTIQYAKAAFGSKKVRDLRAPDIVRFLGLIEQAGSGTTTQRKHLRVLHSCLKAAVRKGYAGRNPVADLDESERPQARRKEAAYFLDDELPRLISELPEGLYRTLCKTALMTGMRLGELSALTWGNVNLVEGTIHVAASYTNGHLGSTKNRNARDVELAPDVVAMLGAWWGEAGKPGEDKLVFPGATKTGFVNEQSLLRRILYPAMERAKVPRACPEGRARGELRTFHSFRHSFSRIALENGRELSWLSRHLGHSSLAITEGVYGHWSKAAAKAQAASMEGVFGV